MRCSARSSFTESCSCTPTASHADPARRQSRGAPEHEPAGSPPDRAPAYIAASRALYARRGQMRILVIEDEPRILEFLRLGLEAEGFTVDGGGRRRRRARPRARRAVRTGRARSAAAASGRAPSARASCAASAPDLPVLILSARSDLPTKLRSFGLGANDYLSKPFSFDELRRARARAPPQRPRRRRGVEPARRRRSSSTSPGARRASTATSSTSRIASSGSSTTSSARRRGREPGAAPLGGLGLQLRPRLERRRRLRAPPAQEARAHLADRDGPACGLSPGGRLARRARAGSPSRWAAWR